MEESLKLSVKSLLNKHTWKSVGLSVSNAGTVGVSQHSLGSHLYIRCNLTLSRTTVLLVVLLGSTGKAGRLPSDAWDPGPAYSPELVCCGCCSTNEWFHWEIHPEQQGDTTKITRFVTVIIFAWPGRLSHTKKNRQIKITWLSASLRHSWIH